MMNAEKSKILANNYRSKEQIKNMIYESKRIKFIEKQINKAIKRGLYFNFMNVKGTHFGGLKEHFEKLGYEVVINYDNEYNFAIGWSEGILDRYDEE